MEIVLKILTLLFYVAVIVGVGIGLILVLSIISHIDDCLQSYRTKLDQEIMTDISKRMVTNAQHSRIIREMIREDVMTEIDIYIKKKELAKEKIVMLNLDKDIEVIANNVHEGYARSLVEADRFSCSSDYIRKEIINYTTILLSSRAMAYNQSLPKE